MTATPDQLAARKDAAKARGGLRAADREALDLATTVVQRRAVGAPTADVERQFTQATTRVAAARAALGAAKAGVVPEPSRLAAGADPMGADLLDPALPVLMLPVRLETRYRNGQLLVRIYPDDVHRYSHEPGLTPHERDWWEQYQKRVHAATDRPVWLAAWRELVTRVGVYRAVYLATLADPRSVGSRPSTWSQAATARLLPDRFVGYAWVSGAVAPIRAVAAKPVVEPLPLGPDPLTANATDQTIVGEGARWLHDFTTALDVGMAIEIPLGSTTAVVTRLVVLGVRASVDRDAQTVELLDQLAAHRFTQGVDLLSPGSPTNALPGARPVYTARPDPDATYANELEYTITGGALHRRRPHFYSAAGTLNRFAASFVMATALGIDPDVIGYADGSAGMGIAREVDGRVLLRTAFERQIVRGLAPSVDEASIAAGFDFMTNATSATGPYATLRLGTQPYGLLPIALPDPARLDPLQRTIRSMLDGLRGRVFTPAIARVARLARTQPADPGAMLLEILRSDAAVREVGLRLAFDPDLSDGIRGMVPPRVVTGFDQGARRSANLLAALGVPRPDRTGIVRSLFTPASARSTLTLIAPANATGSDLPQTYLGWLRTLSIDDILNERYPAARPHALLFDLARMAVLEAADGDARETLATDGHVPVAQFDDAAGPYGAPRKRLASLAPLDTTKTIAERLSARNVGEAKRTSGVFGALSELLPMPIPSLEVMVSGVLGLLAHRLDAWYAGFAFESLEYLRHNPPPGRPQPWGFQSGLGLGAFGWVEAIQRSAGMSSAGFVLAPSQHQAATAGVLLSADVAHRGVGHGRAFAVDLSSARVRTALELLDGIRTQPLAALLGYRIERALVQSGGTVPALIERLRSIAPLTTPHVAPLGRPAETIAADNVVDGLALVERVTNGAKQAPSLDPIRSALGPIDQQQTSALRAALVMAADAVDALTDLMLAEGVHQLVGGTPTRSGAAVDATSGAFVPPPEIAAVRTPVRGVATTHRVMIALNPAGQPTAGWSATPRTAAEPLVDAFVGRLLPSPARVRIRARYLQNIAFVNVERTLADLLAAAQTAGHDELGVAAIDVVIAVEAVEHRVRAMIAATCGVANLTAADVELVDGPGQQWARSQVTLAELLAAARACRAAIGPTRAVTPTDLPSSARVNDTELATRLSNAQNGGDAVSTALIQAMSSTSSDAARTTALYQAGQYGINVAPGAARLPDQVKAAQTTFAQRLAASRVATDPVPARLAALFGGNLPVVSRLTLGDDDLQTAFGEDIGATPSALRTFVARTARVRERINLLDVMLTYADAHTPASSHDFAAAQRPRAPGEQWTALSGSVLSGRTSFVVVKGAGDAPVATRVFAGLFLDDWVEVVPSSQANASLAFHYDGPSSSAPNAMLLCVPHLGQESWTEAVLLAHVSEALDLAKLRAVDPDHLQGAGQLLPALLLDDGDFQSSLATRVTEPQTP